MLEHSLERVAKSELSSLVQGTELWQREILSWFKTKEHCNGSHTWLFFMHTLSFTVQILSHSCHCWLSWMCHYWNECHTVIALFCLENRTYWHPCCAVTQFPWSTLAKRVQAVEYLKDGCNIPPKDTTIYSKHSIIMSCSLWNTSSQDMLSTKRYKKKSKFYKEGFLSSYVESHSDGAFNLLCVIGKKLLFQ